MDKGNKADYVEAFSYSIRIYQEYNHPSHGMPYRLQIKLEVPCTIPVINFR
jgi:hypothetical protein